MQEQGPWRGEVEVEDEHLLTVTSTAAGFEGIRTLVRSEHPDDTPEVLAVAVVAADPAYAPWVADTVGDEADSPGTRATEDGT